MIEVSEIVQVINIAVSDVTETANIIVTEQTNSIILEVAEMGIQGLQGIQGIAGQNAVLPVKIYQEVPNGLVNGSNATFTSVNNFVAGTLELFLNGSLQKIINDYQVIGNNTILLNASPTTSENILINYTKQ